MGRERERERERERDKTRFITENKDPAYSINKTPSSSARNV